MPKKFQTNKERRLYAALKQKEYNERLKSKDLEKFNSQRAEYSRKYYQKLKNERPDEYERMKEKQRKYYHEKKEKLGDEWSKTNNQRAYMNQRKRELKKRIVNSPLTIDKKEHEMKPTPTPVPELPFEKKIDLLLSRYVEWTMAFKEWSTECEEIFLDLQVLKSEMESERLKKTQGLNIRQAMSDIRQRRQIDKNYTTDNVLNDLTPILEHLLNQTKE